MQQQPDSPSEPQGWAAPLPLLVKAQRKELLCYCSSGEEFNGARRGNNSSSRRVGTFSSVLSETSSSCLMTISSKTIPQSSLKWAYTCATCLQGGSMPSHPGRSTTPGMGHGEHDSRLAQGCTQGTHHKGVIGELVPVEEVLEEVGTFVAGIPPRHG